MRVGIKKSLCLLALMGLSQFSTGFAKEAASQSQINDDRITIEKVTEDVHIKMITSKGVIIAKLDFQNAPITVQNFVDYINAGFFDGLIFHRVIDGFMIQGGGFDETMSQKKALYPAIQNEAKNGVSNARGTFAMARTNYPHSATSQFFINLKDNDFLDYSRKSDGYAVFGRVISGMDVVDAIAKVKTGNSKGHSDVPRETIKINGIYLIETPLVD